MKTCFFISPIGDDDSDDRKRSNLVLDYIIKPVLVDLEYLEPTRADLIGKGGSITNEIMTRITTDDIVIADLTGRNPNVFYELAIRHVTNLPIIHIMEASKDAVIPFDVYDVRTVFYDLKDLESVGKAKANIRKQIESFDLDPVVTPVSKFKALRSLYENNDPEKQALAKILNDLSERMGDLFNNEISSVRSELSQMLGELVKIQDLILFSNPYYAENRPPSPFVDKKLQQVEMRGSASSRKKPKSKSVSKQKTKKK